jgi:hypothetical protein
MELLKDTDVLLDKLMETEVETYGEINVRLSVLVNLILHHESELYLALLRVVQKSCISLN